MTAPRVDLDGGELELVGRITVASNATFVGRIGEVAVPAGAPDCAAEAPTALPKLAAGWFRRAGRWTEGPDGTLAHDGLGLELSPAP